jgi:hypothetical protein
VASLSNAELDALVVEAVVDCYGEDEQLSDLSRRSRTTRRSPSPQVLGLEVTVRKVDLRVSGIVAVRHRGRMRQAIEILDLPLPDRAPEDATWIEAYRYRAAR